MAKAEWGTKRRCQGCGAKFYDFGRAPIVCPKCAAVYQIDVEPRRRPRPPDSQAKKRKEAVVAPKPPPDEDVIEAESPQKTEEVLEDASDLGGDEEYAVAEKEKTEEP